MGATFVGVSLRRKTVSCSWCLTAVGVLSCSVFPDEATLPSSSLVAGAGGSSVLPRAGAGAEGGDPAPLGGAGAAAAEGGAFSSAGARAGAPPLGLAGTDVGGAGGGPSCEPEPPVVIAVTADTWIEAARPSIGHGNDDPLSVIGGGQERRALVEVTLPAAPANAVLLKATVALHLKANADIGSTRRQLRLYQLAHPVLEGRATWSKWDNGPNGNWLKLGGDFGGAIAESEVPAGTSTSTLSFDVSTFVRGVSASSPVPLSLILLEISTPPPPPAELAFTSREGDASEVPKLIVEYCQP
jgi:hypothetical protein